MIRTASHDELPAIRELLERANDTPYDLGRVAEEKCFGAGLGGATVVRVAGDYDGVAVTCGRTLRVLAVDRSRRGRGIGSALLRDSNAQIIGAEAGNYFIPGVLDPTFFARRGYVETARPVNMRCSTTGFTPAADVHHGGREALPFIEREFGRAWRFECERAAAIFVTRESGEVTGFAAIEANNRGLGTFGPTGVVRSRRGRGLGRALLHTALAELERLGFDTAIIPWTDSVNFYRRGCHAEIEARFITMTLLARS